ncbi:hypothetical protein [Candidatus Mycoplasma haematominutum]|uniref:Uncharacterized protein n=1 Tax=Candidatus Mycoplasma haematominutum 'Birmingham 1' TaxID=1116213 RepID=G8C398_9MOLU|nr:hypothetical protein [Candidatus Mycoplasma haematominutum]CCE66796.1 hypothetical protein MHM_02780 [Candidatus Mycoplasma haematominutum 'Birmingham 1']
MSSLKDLRQKISLKKFHKKIDDFEERMIEKIKEGWTLIANRISEKLKSDAPKKGKKAETAKKPLKLEKKDAKKAKATTAIRPSVKKSAVPSTSTKGSVKPAITVKKSTPKPPAKTLSKVQPSSTEVPPQVEQSPVVKVEEVDKSKNNVGAKSSSPTAKSAAIDSKKRGRPKKDEGFAVLKPRSMPPVSSKKAKNTKKSKSR